MKGPMRARLEDYNSIIELTEECFQRDKELGGMAARWKHCFRKDKIQNSLVIKDGANVVSHVGCIDQTVMVGESEIRVAGVSSVSTKPSHRGRGLMTKLLLHSIEFMREEGYALSDLGGDRQRYGWFGWEHAGRAWQFRITSRSMGGHAKPHGFMVKGLAQTEDEMETTLRLHNSGRVGLKRDQELHNILLNRSGKETLVAWKNGTVDSYAVVLKEDEKQPRVEELAGTADGVHSILIQLLRSQQAESIVIHMPWNNPLNDRIRSLSTSWFYVPWRMIKIIDLYKTLLGFSKQLESRYRRMGFSGEREVVLGIEDAKTRVNLKFSPEKVVIKETDCSECSNDAIMLTEREMVLMLFGAGGFSSMPTRAKFLEALLPLDFYLWKNETV